MVKNPRSKNQTDFLTRKNNTFGEVIFGYAHSHAVMAGLKAYVKNKGSIITDAYTYIDKPGETTAFRKMLEVAKQGGHDILYVDSVEEFAGNRLADFRQHWQQ